MCAGEQGQGYIIDFDEGACGLVLGCFGGQKKGAVAELGDRSMIMVLGASSESVPLELLRAD